MIKESSGEGCAQLVFPGFSFLLIHPAVPTLITKREGILMLKHKKFAAFILGLTLCAASAAAPAYSAFAEEEPSAAAEESDELFSYGDYKYSLTRDDTVCIEDYTGSEAEVSIPETIDGKTVAEIGSKAFFESSAATVHIPSGVTYIYDNPFLESVSLKEITVDENNGSFYASDGVLYEAEENGGSLLCYPQGKADSSFTVPDGISEIQAAAIYNTQLVELKLPSSLLYVDRHGISYNEKLASIDFSETELYKIGDMAMAYCTALAEVRFSDYLTEIGGAAFAGCTALTEVEFPDSITTIGQNAFAATGLTSVKIPSSVTEIGYCAFGYDENLEPLSEFTVIGETGSAAQTYCTDSDEDYGYENNFSFVAAENAALYSEAAGLESIAYGDYTYAENDGEAYITACVSVEPTIEVPAEINGLPVTRIYSGAFFQSQASSIILPDSVNTIDQIAFYMCADLKSIKLPASLETIGDQAFSDCSALESIEIPASCTSVGKEAFLGCTALKEFTVSGTGGGLTTESGVLYNADKTVIIAYPAAKTDKSYTAPDSVKEILTSAFHNSAYLEKADISSVVTIGSYAFENCSALSEVKLSKELEKIGECAFYNCTALKSLRTYDKITEIGAAAIGYYYDESDTENGGDALVDGFRLYASEDSGGARYAQINSIECVTDTVSVFGTNMEKSFLYVICGAAAAAILAVVGIITGRSIKKRKNKREIERIKDEAQKKLAERASGGKENENDTETE